MKFSLEMSVRGEAAQPEAVVAVAQAAEAAGFEMLGYTDHPAPSKKWLTSGGHPTYDPFAALAFLAAVTKRVRLMTYLAVLPYRNPLLLAKSVASVDRLSGGRFTLVAGTGYLRSEFTALGADLDDRNERFDEAVAVLRGIYQDDEFRYEGRGFQAVGVVHDPLPVQLPHPPIWIGGSSRASRRRVAAYGAGWAPLMPSGPFAKVVRSAEQATVAQLAANIHELWELLDAAGREPSSVSIQVDGVGLVDAEPEEVLSRIAELESVGITHVVARPPDGPVGRVVEAIAAYGEAVIAQT